MKISFIDETAWYIARYEYKTSLDWCMGCHSSIEFEVYKVCLVSCQGHTTFQGNY